MVTKTGGSGDDELIGGAGPDRLYGYRGDDVLEGHDGDDRLRGGRDDDRLEGGAGNDQLFGGRGADTLVGGADSDRLKGGRDDDVLEGGDGDDRLSGQHGDDVCWTAAMARTGCPGERATMSSMAAMAMIGCVVGPATTCSMVVPATTISPAAAAMTSWPAAMARTGCPEERATMSSTAAMAMIWLRGGAGDDLLNGGAGNDDIAGGRGDDVMTYRTGDGDDQISGGHGRGDTIRLDVEDGWILTLSKGQVLSDDDGQMQLSPSAAGTIELADGGTIRFSGIERIEAVAGEPGDHNLPPTDLKLVADPVAENAPDGSVVGTAAATDPDGGAALARLAAAGGSLTYALTDDAGGRFAIDPASGEVTVANGALLDYEDAHQHHITVKVTDPGGLSETATFAIDVQM